MLHNIDQISASLLSIRVKKKKKNIKNLTKLKKEAVNIATDLNSQ